MSEFVAITTQEAFDAAIGERLKRERETVAKKYEGYISPEDNQKKITEYEGKLKDANEKLSEASQKAADYDKQIAERDAKIKGYETSSVKMKIAHEVGIPYELSGRLSGDNEDAIRKDAEALKTVIGSTKPTAPLATGEPTGTDLANSAQTAALKKTLAGLKGEA